MKKVEKGIDLQVPGEPDERFIDAYWKVLRNGGL